MSSITPGEIRQEFYKSRTGIAGIAILLAPVTTSVITMVMIPIETFQELSLIHI